MTIFHINVAKLFQNGIIKHHKGASIVPSNRKYVSGKTDLINSKRPAKVEVSYFLASEGN